MAVFATGKSPGWNGVHLLRNAAESYLRHVYFSSGGGIVTGSGCLRISSKIAPVIQHVKLEAMSIGIQVFGISST